MISLPPVSEEMACNATLWKRFTYSTCSNQILENSIKLFFEREQCHIRSTGTKIVNWPYLPLLMQLLWDLVELSQLHPARGSPRPPEVYQRREVAGRHVYAQRFERREVVRVLEEAGRHLAWDQPQISWFLPSHTKTTKMYTISLSCLRVMVYTFTGCLNDF